MKLRVQPPKRLVLTLAAGLCACLHVAFGQPVALPVFLQGLR